MAYVGILIIFFSLYFVAEFGDDMNPFVALATMSVCGLLVPVGVVFCIILAIRRRWIDVSVLVACSVFYLLISGQWHFNIGPRELAPEDSLVRAMTFNIEHGWQSIERIAKCINDNKVEVFSLQECGLGEDSEAIAALKSFLPEYHLFSDGSRTCGTNLPVVRERSLKLDSNQWGWTMIEIVVEKDGHRLRVLNVHSPSYLPEKTFRRSMPEWFSRFGEVSVEQTQLIKTELKIIEFGNMPTVLCGDFNMAPVGSKYRLLSNTGVDAFHVAGKGAGWTSPSRLSLRRIDQIWSFNGAHATDCFVVDPRGSDHAAVVADIAFR